MTGVFFVSLPYLEEGRKYPKEVAMIKLLTSAEGRLIYEKLGFESSNEMVLLCK